MTLILFDELTPAISAGSSYMYVHMHIHVCVCASCARVQCAHHARAITMRVSVYTCVFSVFKKENVSFYVYSRLCTCIDFIGFYYW